MPLAAVHPLPVSSMASNTASTLVPASPHATSTGSRDKRENCQHSTALNSDIPQTPSAPRKQKRQSSKQKERSMLPFTSYDFFLGDPTRDVPEEYSVAAVLPTKLFA